MLLGLRFARRAARGERERPGQTGLRAEAASGKETSHATEREPERDREACHVGRLPEREAIATEEPDRGRDRAEQSAEVREAAGPELRPREAVALLRVADRLRRIPDAAVYGRR